MNEDPMAPSKGILIGALVGMGIWAVLIAAVVLVTR